jgi:hypothetical protein
MALSKIRRGKICTQQLKPSARRPMLATNTLTMRSDRPLLAGETLGRDVALPLQNLRWLEPDKQPEQEDPAACHQKRGCELTS